MGTIETMNSIITYVQKRRVGYTVHNVKMLLGAGGLIQPINCTNVNGRGIGNVHNVHWTGGLIQPINCTNVNGRGTGNVHNVHRTGGD